MSQSSTHHLQYRELMSLKDNSSSRQEQYQRFLYLENYNSNQSLTIKKSDQMAIIATAASQRELLPAGNYVARCYSMIQLGTVTEVINGETKTLSKVRIGWELPTKQKVFKEGEPAKPYTISNEYTLSMGEKANLRKMLASWRGKDFTADEVKAFDITKVIGAPCMLNLIHKASKNTAKIYEEIASITPLPDGFTCPDQINETVKFEFDNFNGTQVDSFPDFIKDKIKSSKEFKDIMAAFNQEPAKNASIPVQEAINQALQNQPAMGYNPSPENVDDLPF